MHRVTWNQQLSRTELLERFELYKRLRVGLTSQGLRLTLNGKPLAFTKVHLVPEPWLEGVIEPAVGKTDSEGTVFPETSGQDFPGVRTGFYHIKIASDQLTDEQASRAVAGIGVEVSPVSDKDYSSGVIHLSLRL